MSCACVFALKMRLSFSADSPAGSLHHVGHKFHEVFQLKQGRFSDLPPAKISEMLKSASLDVNFLCVSYFICVCILTLSYKSEHVSLSERPNTVSFKCCEWNLRREHGQEKWGNSLCMSVLHLGQSF